MLIFVINYGYYIRLEYGIIFIPFGDSPVKIPYKTMLKNTRLLHKFDRNI